MAGECKIKRDHIEGKDWAPAFFREMDLIIAANELSAHLDNKTLYNDLLDDKVAELLIHFDKELEIKQLPMIKVEPNDEHPWKRVPDALKALEGLPRGHWAVLECDGKYDAYMSDGYGGTGTRSGNKFIYGIPTAPALNGPDLYGQVLGMIIYRRRNEIRNRIFEHAFDAADIKTGHIIKDVHVSGKRFTKVELHEMMPGYYVGGGHAIKLHLTRPGAKKAQATVTVAQYASLARLELSLPPEFEAPDLADRLVDGFQLPSTGPRP